MRLETNALLGGPSRPQGPSATLWLLTGAEAPAVERLAPALSRFGIDARSCLQVSPDARQTPVLCDARMRPVVRAWLDDIPWRSAPIVFFGVGTASGRAQLIAGGADDAVSARVAPAELAARMHAAMRSQAATQGIVRLAGFEFDTGLRHVRFQGEGIPLMPREFDLLLVLARQAGMPISRGALLRAVWRTAFDPGTNSLEVHICKLRRSLAMLNRTVWIETVRHQGYRLICDRIAMA